MTDNQALLKIIHKLNDRLMYLAKMQELHAKNADLVRYYIEQYQKTVKYRDSLINLINVECDIIEGLPYNTTPKNEAL